MRNPIILKKSPHHCSKLPHNAWLQARYSDAAACHLPRVTGPALLPPALVVWGVAGAFMVPYGCQCPDLTICCGSMGIHVQLVVVSASAVMAVEI